MKARVAQCRKRCLNSSVFRTARRRSCSRPPLAASPARPSPLLAPARSGEPGGGPPPVRRGVREEGSLLLDVGDEGAGRALIDPVGLEEPPPGRGLTVRVDTVRDRLAQLAPRAGPA